MATKALSPTAWSPCGERTVTSSMRPRRRPRGAHGAVRGDRDLGLGDVGGDRDRRLDGRAARGREPARAVEVQGAVAGERLAAVGEADAEEALALDGDVERLVRALQRALGERAAGVDRARRRRRSAAPRRRGGRPAGT